MYPSASSACLEDKIRRFLNPNCFKCEIPSGVPRNSFGVSCLFSALTNNFALRGLEVEQETGCSCDSLFPHLHLWSTTSCPNLHGSPQSGHSPILLLWAINTSLFSFNSGMDVTLVLGLRLRSLYDWIDAEGVSFSHTFIHALSILALITRWACDRVCVSSTMGFGAIARIFWLRCLWSL